MRPKLNLKDKSQMSTPNEYTDNLKSNLICIFLSVRTKSKIPLCPRTQCSIYGVKLTCESANFIIIWTGLNIKIGIAQKVYELSLIHI